MPDNAAIQLAQLEHSAIIELFVLDATSLGGDVLRFHNGTNELGGDVVWRGEVYGRLPVEAEGFARRAEGPLPRPTLRVSNLGGMIGALARAYRGLRGARLIRRRVLAKYLDAANFQGGNPSADPSAGWPDETWEIDRQSQRNRVLVEYELVSLLDVAGVMLPRRQITSSHCPWVYRGPDCGYTGPAAARADDTPTSNLAEDVCGHRLSSCRRRAWPFGELGFGGFPGAGVTRNV